ncbi:hypothetical protein LLH23_10580 [bacterium]|nr:hypothetical protein [bacterium]
MSTRIPLILSLVALAAGLCTAEPVDLIAGLNSGQLWAEFRGAGDRAVTGTIGRTGDAPLDVNIPAGTQFWAQAGGRQGQSTIGGRSFGLRDVKDVQVTLATCCTNLGLREATAADLMIPVACPDVRVARLLSLPGIDQQPHMAVQAAVWAIANDARPTAVRRALRAEPGVGCTAFADEMVGLAASLIRACGLEPGDYRLFR